MSKPIGQLLNEYSRWLRSGLSHAQIGDAYEVTTPFLDRHNDHLQIYVRREDGHLVLSDDGYVVSDLLMSGCPIDSPRRQAFLRSILGGFGVQMDGEALTVVAHNEDFPQRKHALIQAMLAVGDLFATAKSNVQSLFLEDVSAFLDSAGARYIPNLQLAGRSGFQHKYDFAIPKSPQAPLRLVRAINAPSKQSAELTIFAWTDTQPTRDDDARMFAILNDTGNPVSGEVLSAFKQYDIEPVPFTKREDFASQLAA